MHFAKTYSQLLLDLPQDLRQNAIQYRQLKKLINQVVAELTSLGFSPEILHHILDQTQTFSGSSFKGKEKATDGPLLGRPSNAHNAAPLHYPRVSYEFQVESDRIEPRLHVWLHSYDDDTQLSPLCAPLSFTASVLRASPKNDSQTRGEAPSQNDGSSTSIPGDAQSQFEKVKGVSEHRGDVNAQELIVPLASDTAFFQMLVQALYTMSAHLLRVRASFNQDLEDLSRDISFSARPMSSTSSFSPHSHHSNPGTVRVKLPSSTPFSSSDSDLYAWREILKLYFEAEVFESHSEKSRGQRTVDEAERRMAAFLQSLSMEGFANGRKLKLKQSKKALSSFLRLNALILDLLKFQHATTEALRKILKKHAKRTALPLPPNLSSPYAVNHVSDLLPQTSSLMALVPNPTVSLSVNLAQAVSQMLLPVIPHIDDYACVICTSIAFKPIRLRCGHLFCVRCLVKMQKRGKGNCPMCRAPTVLIADRSNVDWALLNFMKDWFPVESRKKLHQSEQEAAEEEMAELGLSVHGCVVA